MRKDIPRKFAKSKKSFVERLSEQNPPSSMSAFCPFPNNIQFNGQDKGEHIVLLMRQHPAVFIKKYLIILFFLMLPLLSVVIFRILDPTLNFAFLIGVGLVFLLISLTMMVDTFAKWYFSANIITEKRIVDVDFSNVLFHRFSEAQLGRIEDVSHAPIGILSSVFDYGNVYVQTAGTKPEFEFLGVPRPRDAQDTLLDLLEMRHKNKI